VSYLNGASKGAPQAKQVLDRWHLLKNLGEVLQKSLAQQMDVLLAAAREAVPPESSGEPSAEAKRPNSGRKERVRAGLRFLAILPDASLLLHANSGSGSCRCMNRSVGFRQRVGLSGPSWTTCISIPILCANINAWNSSSINATTRMVPRSNPTESTWKSAGHKAVGWSKRSGKNCVHKALQAVTRASVSSRGSFV
jgi:hypothetical protein